MVDNAIWRRKARDIEDCVFEQGSKRIEARLLC
jgi:hypothetical protein